MDADVDPQRAAACNTMLFRYAWGVGNSRLAVDALDTAAALLPPDVPSAELAGLLAEQARHLMLTDNLDQAAAKAREAITAARAVSARVVEGNATNTLDVCIS